MLRVNDENDLEKVYPEETPGHPGFYYFPDDKRISINHDGIVINNRTGAILKQHKHKSSRYQITITSPGQKHKTYKTHRIIARTFIGRPSRHLNKKFKDLEVNHIDGNPSNNKLENLEWVTGKENIVHSHKNGLHGSDKKVVAKNINTNTFLYFNSSKACADYFQIHRATMWKHLNKGKPGKYHVDGFVFKNDDSTPWVIYPRDQIMRLSDNTETRIFKIKNKKDNSVALLSGYYNTSKEFNVSVGTLFRSIKKFGKYSDANIEITPITKEIDF